MKKVSFRWGVAELESDGSIYLHGFMLRNYAKLGLTRDEFLCLVHFAAYHYESEDGESRPASKTIANQMGYAHVNSVYRLIKSLTQKGMIEVTKHQGKPSTINAAGFARKAIDLHGQVVVPPHPSVTVPQHANVDEEKEPKKKKDKKTLADKPRTEKQITTKILVEVFEKASGIKEPDHETSKAQRATAVQWWNPLWNIYKMCDKDIECAKRLVWRVINSMRGAGLTIASPQSIVKVAASIHGEAQTNNSKPKVEVFR